MKKKAILIAGPTASGKSSLALNIAKAIDGVIVNADALQVYENWCILTARPLDAELAQAPHYLYGHVGKNDPYSVGHWIKEVVQLLDTMNKSVIIVGGTGLYFTALTGGLSEIPAISPEIRAESEKLRAAHGIREFLEQLRANDPETLATLDQNNPARLQRAWEVLAATGKGMNYWHKRPTRAALPLEETIPILLNWNTFDLNYRIDQRFDIMMESGAIDECEMARTEGYDPKAPANRAIGAREIIQALDGKITMQDAVIKSKILTHQFAKRQRNWFRGKMKDWRQVDMSAKPDLNTLTAEIVDEFR